MKHPMLMVARVLFACSVIGIVIFFPYPTREGVTCFVKYFAETGLHFASWPFAPCLLIWGICVYTATVMGLGFIRLRKEIEKQEMSMVRKD